MWSETKMAAKVQRSYNVSDASSSCESNSTDDDSVYENKANYRSGKNMSKVKRTTSVERELIAAKRTKQSASSSDAQDYSEKFGIKHQRTSILQDYTKYNRDTPQISSKSKRSQEFQLSNRKTSGKGQHCHSRNAVMARINRLKKKQHLETLENGISKATQENYDLKGTVASQAKIISSMKNRIHYLEGVLANSRELGMLLKTVQKATGLPTINSLGKSGPQPQTNIQNVSTAGYPPPQPDHIYSKTPDVSSAIVTGSISPIGEDNLINITNSFLLDDQSCPLLSDDVSLPLLPLEDDPKCFEMSPGTPNSDNSYLLDYAGFNQPFDFENFDEDHLTSGVGICLHIAKKRVSLEFCQSCNNNSVAAWDENIFADG